MEKPWLDATPSFASNRLVVMCRRPSSNLFELTCFVLAKPFRHPSSVYRQAATWVNWLMMASTVHERPALSLEKRWLNVKTSFAANRTVVMCRRSSSNLFELTCFVLAKPFCHLSSVYRQAAAWVNWLMSASTIHVRACSVLGEPFI